MTFKEAKSILNKLIRVTAVNTLGKREILWKDKNGRPLAYANSDQLCVGFIEKDKDGDWDCPQHFLENEAYSLTLCGAKTLHKDEVIRPYELLKEELLKWS